MAQLAPLVVPALKKHTATVIWAHGLGDTSPSTTSPKPKTNPASSNPATTSTSS
ncbi:MAG: hypothetical protein Q9198_006641 [Flavoplaca austrocitrina]